MQRAVNPDTGEVLYLVNNQWVPPAQVATNPKTGEVAHLVGNQWQVMPVAKPSADLPAPESDLKAGLLAGTKLSPDAPPMGNRMLTEVGQAPIPGLKELPKLDASQMPTAEDRAVAQFGITPEMGMGEKALRTAKGSLYGAATGLEQTWLGGARMISDLTGLGKEGVEGASKQLSKEQQAVEKTYAPEYGLKIAKDIGASVIQNIPTIGAGLYAGSAAALTNMWTQSFMQTYDDSRNEGLGVGASTARSALYGTAEAIGESIGLPNLLKSAKAALKGVPTADLAKEMSKYILKEIPGEQLTYVAQFLTDKGFGLNPEAGMKEFLQGVQDTALVTVGQTAVMGGAGFTTNKILKELRDLHSKGEEGVPKAKDMMKQAGFTFERPPEAQPQATPQATPQVEPQAVPEATPEAATAVPPSGAIKPEDIEEPVQVAPTPAPAVPEAAPEAAPTEAPKTTAEKLDKDFMWRKDGVDIPIQVVAEKLGTNEQGQREVIALVDGQEQSIPVSEIVKKTETTPVAPEAQALPPTEAPPTAVPQAEPTEELPRRSKAKDVPVIPEGQTLDSSDPEVLKKFNEIVKTYKPESGHAYEDSFLEAINNDVRAKQEKIEAPPFKKGWASSASIEVAPFNGGWVGGSMFMGNAGGYASGPSIWDEVYPTKQEAINAQIDQMRKSATTYADKKALSWLDSIDPRLTKEGKIETNKARQAEKKAPKKKVKVEQEHIEGEKTEPVTSATIEESIAKAESKVDHKKIKTAIKNQFDQAIKRSAAVTEDQWKKLPKKDQLVVIDVPGDGKFTLKNYTENLQKYQKRVLNAAIPKQATPKRETVTAVSVSAPDVAFKNLLDTGDVQAAVEYGKLKKIDLDPSAKQITLTPEQRKILTDFFGSKEKYQEYKDEVAGIQKGEFTSNIDEKTINKMLRTDRDEMISEYAQARAAGRRALKKIAKYGSDIPMQKELNSLLEKEAALKDALEETKPERNSAEDFMARATQEVANGNMEPAVEQFIRTVFEKDKAILEGLKLSLRTRQAGGRDSGNFNPYTRVVTLWKDSSGVDDPKTIRHELTHTLEQMMTPKAKQAIVDAWGRAFENELKTNRDPAAQKYFAKVLEFLDSPSKDTLDAATAVMPSYDLYQYINPSEFWAVNAESLLKAQMGTPWSRFVSGIKKLFEGLKNVFGMKNNYAVHKEFADIMKGERTRASKDTIANYLFDGKAKLDFLKNVEDVEALLKKHNRPDTPLHPSGSVSDAFMGTVQTAKKIATRVKENPTLVVPNMIGKADRAITYMRNKSVWYGTGLESADFAKYNGQLKDSHGTAVASVAVTNAIHAGHVGTQVMIQGKLQFDPKLQMFTAKKSDKSMANVITLKTDLAKKLGAQTANNLINGYFEAKRSRSIINEYLNREAEYEDAIASGEDVETAQKNLKNIEVARQKVNMDDEQIDDFIAMDKKYPELRKMMDNWTAVNHNMIDNMEFSGIISKKRAQQLKDIEDYVPWYRIMDNQSDIHQPTGGVVRTLTHVGKEKTFKQGETDRDIDDIVDNMIHNVMMMTRNSMRNYAANRVVMEYGTRKDNGKLKVFPQEDHANGIFNILAAGRRINVQIADPLIAEAVIGMENTNIPMFKMMEAFTGTTANILRRTITTNPVFQLKQVFKDAPTAAWVSGMRNPFPIWASTFSSFVSALNPKDPIVQKLKQAGIGGFQSTARSPEKELKLEIGLLNHSAISRVLKTLDHIGDASDYAQRRAIYKKVLAKTGDEMQALMQANNVIDFLKRGSSGTAQFLSRNVAFMNAYAQQIDVLAQTLAGGGLKGRSRSAAIKNMAILGGTLAMTSLMYAIAVGSDPDYQELDDDTKVRNIFIPKSLTKFVGMDRALLLPMNTSASFFFKSMPELLYNKVMNEGTKYEVDNTRLRKSIKNAMVDSLLGPNPVPTGVKPFVEIGLNKNFFTGGNITPKGMEKLDAAEQYNANTSELGKTLSGLMNGALNPMETDHLMRSLGGSVSAMAMWGSNLLSSDRPADELKQMPIVGQFVLKDVPRGSEDLFYDFKERSDQKYNTWNKLMEREKFDEADKYLDKNEGLISAHDYVTAMDASLKELNKQIRTIGEVKDKSYTPGDKRADITDLQRLKLEMLEDIRQERKDAGL